MPSQALGSVLVVVVAQFVGGVMVFVRLPRMLGIGMVVVVGAVALALVGVGMAVLVQVVVAVGMGVGVAVHRVAVAVFMGVNVGMFVHVLVLVFVAVGAVMAAVHGRFSAVSPILAERTGRFHFGACVWPYAVA